jgi:hypothetical protein
VVASTVKSASGTLVNVNWKSLAPAAAGKVGRIRSGGIVHGRRMRLDRANGVRERNLKAIPIVGTVVGSARITLGLSRHILWIDGNFFGLNDAKENAVHEQSIIYGAIFRGEFGDGVKYEIGCVESFAPRNDLPLRIDQAKAGINPHFSSQPLSLVHAG